MKKSLFLYLFVIALLFNVFTYAYFSKQQTFEKQQSEKKIKVQKDSILVLYNQLVDESYFSVQKNQNAQDYLVEYDVNELSQKISNQILDMNENPKGNPLVPYDQINSQKFIINKVKVLNHRWIIADFTDGVLWGELLLKYFIEEDKSLTFERIESQLYPKQE